MRKFIDFKATELEPSRNDVLELQGVKPSSNLSVKIAANLDAAYHAFHELARPIGMIADISIPDFRDIYSDNEMNAKENPLEIIFPKADKLAFFAFTLGEEISEAINSMFKTGDFVQGYMLDSVASCGADNAGRMAEDYFGEGTEKALLYSPGYCGWHISGQEKLFEFLKPEKINITLNESFLMSPIKSLSGVLVAGRKEIHHFDNDYSFCGQCRTINCKTRQLQ